MSLPPGIDIPDGTQLIGIGNGQYQPTNFELYFGDKVIRDDDILFQPLYLSKEYFYTKQDHVKKKLDREVTFIDGKIYDQDQLNIIEEAKIMRNKYTASQLRMIRENRTDDELLQKLKQVRKIKKKANAAKNRSLYHLDKVLVAIMVKDYDKNYYIQMLDTKTVNLLIANYQKLIVKRNAKKKATHFLRILKMQEKTTDNNLYLDQDVVPSLLESFDPKRRLILLKPDAELMYLYHDWDITYYHKLTYILRKKYAKGDKYLIPLANDEKNIYIVAKILKTSSPLVLNVTQQPSMPDIVTMVNGMYLDLNVNENAFRLLVLKLLFNIKQKITMAVSGNGSLDIKSVRESITSRYKLLRKNSQYQALPGGEQEICVYNVTEQFCKKMGEYFKFLTYRKIIKEAPLDIVHPKYYIKKKKELTLNDFITLKYNPKKLIDDYTKYILDKITDKEQVRNLLESA
jgi:hypothetical protein